MINVELKGGAIKEFENGTTPAEIAKSIGAGLYKSVCCAKVDGDLCDLRTPLEKDCKVELLTFDNVDGQKTFWHTASHVLAQAVKRLYPNAKCAIGPAVDNGFYYDFDVEKPFSPEDLEKIKAEMKKIVKSGLELERVELSPEEAEKKLEEMNEPYKVELVKEHSDKGEHITFYKQGEFIDLCAGPHLMSVAPIKAIELTACTGLKNTSKSLKKQSFVTTTSSVVNLNTLQLLTMSVRDFLFFFQRVQELFSFYRDGLKMLSSQRAVFLQKLLFLQREIFIRFQVTGIIILTVCLYSAIRMMKKRNASHFVL